MAHRDHHPTPDPTCFGCKVASIGWQGRQSAAGGRKSDPTQDHRVTADDGPARGQVVGKHREHWDGRQDATVFAPTHKVKTKSSEER